MKSRDYCCCAIPFINVGAYAALTEQFTLALVVGLLSFFTPSIVGASTPSFASFVMGGVSLLAAALQIMGFFAVAKANKGLFRRYLSLHLIVTIAAFAVAITWTVISVINHSTAQRRCLNDFFEDANDTLRSQGDTLCTVFSYVDVGIMAGLIVLFVITQIYLYIVLLAYPTSLHQVSKSSYELVSSKAVLNTPESLPMSNRTNVYADDNGVSSNYGHLRQDSAASMSDVLSEPLRRPQDGMSQQQRYDTEPYPIRPTNAYTQEPGPTPNYNAQFYDSPHGSR